MLGHLILLQLHGHLKFDQYYVILLGLSLFFVGFVLGYATGKSLSTN